MSKDWSRHPNGEAQESIQVSPHSHQSDC